MTMMIEFDDETPPSVPPSMVNVCTKCGRGFPNWMQSITIDSSPVWWWDKEHGPMCGGRVISVLRASHIENVAKALLQIKLSRKIGSGEGNPNGA
jgi:hypothetical protein